MVYEDDGMVYYDNEDAGQLNVDVPVVDVDISPNSSTSTPQGKTLELQAVDTAMAAPPTTKVSLV